MVPKNQIWWHAGNTRSQSLPASASPCPASIPSLRVCGDGFPVGFAAPALVLKVCSQQRSQTVSFKMFMPSAYSNALKCLKATRPCGGEAPVGSLTFSSPCCLSLLLPHWPHCLSLQHSVVSSPRSSGCLSSSACCALPPVPTSLCPNVPFSMRVNAEYST